MKTLQTAFLTILVLFLCTPHTQADTLDDVQFFVDTYYYGDMPENLYTMTSVDDIIHSLDEYSRYLTAEEYQLYLASVANNKPPATIASTTAPRTQQAVTSSMLHGNIGYLKIAIFSADLDQKVQAHWLALKKAGATELIIDLRYNGGGYVDSAEQLLGFFPGVTKAYHLATREGTEMIKPITTSVKFPKQTYVLVNRYSASASEIVAVALKDQQAATIVGETTKGKGSIQSFFPFEDGGALKLTIGQFTGPEGTKVHKLGVKPTIPTAANKELITIHQQRLEHLLTAQHYRKIEDLPTSTVDKIFRVHFTQAMNLSDAQTSNRIELIELGGAAVPITFNQTTSQTLEIIPKNDLQPGAYMLIIHPGLPNTDGRTTKQGTMTTINIASTTANNVLITS